MGWREVDGEHEFAQTIGGAMGGLQAVSKSASGARAPIPRADLYPASLVPVAVDRDRHPEPTKPVPVQDRISDSRPTEFLGCGLERPETQVAGAATSAPLDVGGSTQYVGGVRH